MQTRRANPEQTAQIHFRESKDRDTGLLHFDGEDRVKEKKCILRLGIRCWWLR